VINSAALDVAIGLILVYLVLSLVSSAVNEIFEGFLKHRAIDLERGLRELLADKDGTGLCKRLYEHPLVFGLFQGSYNPATPKNLPSYIPSRNFALAIMDIVLPAAEGKPSGAEGAQAPIGTPPTSVKSLRDAVAAMQGNESVRRALLTLIDSAGNDMVQARANIEQWFNSSMDRVSGWYKRRKQKIIVVIGLVIAAVMNVSTLTVAKTLWTNQTLRDSLSKVAQDYVQQVDTATTAGATPELRLKQNVHELQNVGLPIGWTKEELNFANVQQDLGAWAERLLGWLLTTCAISLGAPFWFDLLNKISIVRATVKPRETSEGEGSKG
jgi:hypothetical protein